METIDLHEGFQFLIGTRATFDAANDLVQIQDITGAVIDGAFEGVEAGDFITIFGDVNGNDGTFQVASTDGTTLTPIRMS